MALPNVAFMSPPSVWLVYIASSSVVKPSSAARGMSASSAKRNVHAGPAPTILARKASGVNTSRTLIGEYPISAAVLFCRYSPKGSAWAGSRAMNGPHARGRCKGRR
eukprot:COSAG01_NODE_774_length_13702_cov_11.108726_5_plen_107_part_00